MDGEMDGWRKHKDHKTIVPFIYFTAVIKSQSSPKSALCPNMSLLSFVFTRYIQTSHILMSCFIPHQVSTAFNYALIQMYRVCKKKKEILKTAPRVKTTSISVI